MKHTKITALLCATLLAITPVYAYASNLDKEQTTVAAEIVADDIYTAPENKNHANVSFDFVDRNEVLTDGFEYPVSLELKDIHTGDKFEYKVKTSGQILEVEKGDYIVSSIKDSSRTRYIAFTDTVEIYGNKEYLILYAEDMLGNMFRNFIKDNIILITFLAIFAFAYKHIIVSRFSNDIRR